MPKKIKALTPSLKEKKRYLAFKVIAETETIEFDSVRRAIYCSHRASFGDIGLAEAGIIAIKKRWDGKQGLIRVGHKHVDSLKASLALIKDIEGNKAIFMSTRTSGMIGG